MQVWCLLIVLLLFTNINTEFSPVGVLESYSRRFVVIN
jgi:hypothetical protein